VRICGPKSSSCYFPPSGPRPSRKLLIPFPIGGITHQDKSSRSVNPQSQRTCRQRAFFQAPFPPTKSNTPFIVLCVRAHRIRSCDRKCALASPCIAFIYTICTIFQMGICRFFLSSHPWIFDVGSGVSLFLINYCSLFIPGR